MKRTPEQTYKRLNASSDHSVSSQAALSAAYDLASHPNPGLFECLSTRAIYRDESDFNDCSADDLADYIRDHLLSADPHKYDYLRNE